MKSFTISILIGIFTISCMTAEETKLVYSEENTDYKIEISTIGTKIDANGIAQCSKYVKTTLNDSVYESYGLDLPTQLGYAMHTRKKYLTGSDLESLKRFYLSIAINNLSNEPLNYDSIIHFSIAKAFNLETIPISKEISGYQLHITDADKLNENLARCEESSRISYKDGVFIGPSMRISGISNIIDQNLDDYFDSNIEQHQCYNLEFIVNRDINKINAKLQKFGLQYEKGNYEQVFYEVKTTTHN